MRALKTSLLQRHICAIAEKRGAVMIEGAAESLGATYKGKQTETFGTYNAIILVEVMNITDNLCKKIA